MTVDADGRLVIGLLGCGVVGGGVAERLRSPFITAGRPLRLGRVLVRDLARPSRQAHLRAHLTTDARRVLEDPEVDIIVECIGGIEPAGRLVEGALRRGRHVVTANKELIADRGGRLKAIAAERSVCLLFDAAVGGVAPMVRTVECIASSDRILEVGGILNATTNFILGALERGMDLDAALRAARASGIAEADASDDLDASDAARKLAILATIAFGATIDWRSIARDGIGGIDPGEVRSARRKGRRVKLVAWARRTGDAVTASVGPISLPLEHPLASPNGAENLALIVAERSGRIAIGGLGGGREPTASAVVADVIEVAASYRRTSPASRTLEREIRHA